MLKYIFLLLLPAALKAKEVLLTGQVRGDKLKSFTIVLDDNLINGHSEVVYISASGSFMHRMLLPPGSTGHLLIQYGENDPLELYFPKSNSINLRWDAGNFLGSVAIVNRTDELNTFLIGYQQTIPPLREKAEADLDSCTSSASFNNIISMLNDQEYQYLRNKGAALDSLQYQRAAYDIFYKNMVQIINSPFFNTWHFSDAETMMRFPPILLYDKRTDQLLSSQLAKQSGMNASMREKISRSEAAGIFRSTYSIIDKAAFPVSYAYRNVLYRYMEHLATDLYNRKLGKDIVTSVSDYRSWLSSILGEETMVNWLVATRVQRNIMTTGANMSLTELQEQLKMVHDPGMEQTLMAGYRLFSKQQAGAPAPPLSFLDLKKKLISLDSFKGQYVYIDFWDSACLPCIEDIRHYSRAVSKKYEGRKIVFLYVSLDANDAQWQRSLKQHNPAGINGRADGGWKNESVKHYNIQAIPRYVIINPDGSIRNAQAQGLYALLINDPFN